MRKLQILMPMAGAGSRFVDAGFNLPKPMIPVGGIPMFQKALSSLDNISATKRYICVIRQEHVETQKLDVLIKKTLPEAEVVIIPRLTRGAAETALAAKHILKRDDGLIIMDCDLWFHSQGYERIVSGSLKGKNNVDGALLTFSADNPRYSYARLVAGDNVVETAEKRIISPHAIMGAYFFATADKFLTAAEKMVSQPLGEKMPEYYISLLYNILINEGQKFKAASVDEFASFGTPGELESYEKQAAK